MAKTLDFAYQSPQEVKVGDDETTFTLICKNEDKAVDLTGSESIIAKIGNQSGYLREQPINLDSSSDMRAGQINLTFEKSTLDNFPPDLYNLEIWVTNSNGTSIYPSGNPLSFTVTANIENSSGANITTVAYDDFVKAMNKAASTIAKGDKGEKGDPGDNGFYHYTVDLTDTKYDRNKWYYVETDGHQLGSLGGPSYFSLEAPLFSGINVSYGSHIYSDNTIKDASARQTVLYGQGAWGVYDRKLTVLDDQTKWTTDGKRLLTFAVPSDNNFNYAFYARGGLKINITSDVPGLTWTPQTDKLVVNDTTISVLNDAPDPKALGLDDDHTFWALPMSQLKQQLKTS